MLRVVVRTLDQWIAIVFLGLALVGAGFYLQHVRNHGKLNYERIASVGDGALVREGVFEMGYWWMQPVARVLVSAGFSANAVTWMSLVAWGMCAVQVGTGYLGMACVVGSGAAFADTLDGLVARQLQTASAAGEVLDGTVDRYGDVLLFGGILIFYNGVIALQVVALLALAGAMAVSHASSKSEELGIPVSKGYMRRPERCVTLLLGLGLAAITSPIFHAAAPLVVAMALVGVIGNWSAVTRLRELTRAIRIAEIQQRGDSVGVRPTQPV